MAEARVTLSVVSHRQNALVNQLLADLARVCAEPPALVVTENVPDGVAIEAPAAAERIVNDAIKGFGANHNAAFTRCRTEYFCVCNPDIRLDADPFPALIAQLQDPRIGIAGPLVRNPAGAVEDSARRFPTFLSLVGKAFADRRAPDYPTDRGPQEVDWVAGMFMLFRRDAFEAVKGFDEAYFLYYEDVDICDRLGTSGRKAVYVPGAEVVHDAQRASRRNAGRAVHHLRSAARFLARRRGRA
jgi:GT2 family glycosyltransferase